MRTKFTSITLMVSALCFASPCFAAGADDGLRGVDRIDDSRGGYMGMAINTGGAASSFFGFHFGDRVMDHNGYKKIGWIKHCGDCYFPPESLVPRTITGDIKGAILDQNRFDLALTENRFFEAWCMGAETEQGILWKRIAMGKTRERVSQLVTRSILEDNPDKMAEAVGISALFPDPIRADLIALIEAEAASARAIHGGLAPETAARLVALRSISDRLFG